MDRLTPDVERLRELYQKHTNAKKATDPTVRFVAAEMCRLIGALLAPSAAQAVDGAIDGGKEISEAYVTWFNSSQRSVWPPSIFAAGWIAALAEPAAPAQAAEGKPRWTKVQEDQMLAMRAQHLSRLGGHTEDFSRGFSVGWLEAFLLYAAPRPAAVTEAMVTPELVEVLCFGIYGNITWPSMNEQVKASCRQKWGAALARSLATAKEPAP